MAINNKCKVRMIRTTTVTLGAKARGRYCSPGKLERERLATLERDMQRLEIIMAEQRRAPRVRDLLDGS